MLRFPRKYLSGLKALSKVHSSVEKTHKGLGRLALMSVLADACNRTLLVVGSSGTGKSEVMKWHREVIQRDTFYLDAITVAGMKYIAKKLSGKEVSLLIDDVSKGQTEYAQVSTVTALGELVYSGFVKKYTAQLELDIHGFKGACVLNAQPLILKRILRAAEFETDIRDKVIRFYHLRRPIKANLAGIKDNIKYGYGWKEVEFPASLYQTKMVKAGLGLFRYEFTEGRAKQHYTALCQASASVNGRKKVEEPDMWLINELCKCFVLETELFSKEDLEGERRLDVNIMPLLSAVATFKSVPVKALMLGSQVRESRIYEILQNNANWVDVVKNNGHKLVVPTRAGKELLRSIGEWED